MVKRGRLKKKGSARKKSRLKVVGRNKRLFKFLEARDKFQKAELKNKGYNAREEGPRYQIPTLTMSGGTLEKLEDAVEFRVWVHPKSEDDFYYSYKRISEARSESERMRATGEFAKVETPLAVVWDNKFQNFKEVALPKKRFLEEL